MARPTRTNAEYFYHPATFRNDRRVKAIRARFGACGYGLLLMLIELLTDADNTALSTDEMEVELLAGDLSSTVEDVTNLIQAAEKVGLFGRNEDGLLKCPQLDEWLAPVFEKRNRSRNTPVAPKLSQPVTETPISVTETPPVKESREEYRKEEESKDVLTTSSLRSEDAATAAALPEKKIEAEELPAESPADQKKPPVAKPPRGQKDKRPEPEHFAAFWQSYARHDDRAAAVAAFRKLSPADQQAAATRAAAWLSARPDLHTTRGDFRPHAATWLNKTRWTDDVPAIAPSQPTQPHANASNGAQQNNRYHTTRHAGGFGSFGTSRTPGSVAAQPFGVAAAGGPVDAVPGITG
jgi:hypothetical protein